MAKRFEKSSKAKRKTRTVEQEGQLAMSIISDYPLYAKTSGITYEEAIAVAKAICGTDYKKELEEAEVLGL